MGSGSVSVPYCELQAHHEGEGCLVMYESEQCDTKVASVPITASTFLQAKQGIDCSLFTVGSLRLCARTAEERQLWHRAISNVQVKCYNGAPDPTSEDLANFREAVMERVRALELMEGVQRVVGGPGPSLPEVAPKLARVPVAQPGQPAATIAPTPSQPPPQRNPTEAAKAPDNSTASEPDQLRGTGLDVGALEDCGDDEPSVATRCHKPPPSQPGPGLHEPLWQRRPQPDALQRATDVALNRMSRGQLSI